MKQKDIILIIVIVFISGTLSFFVSKKLFAKPKDRSVEVKIVEAINTDFNKPDQKYFNEESINPTQIIQIGQDQPQPTTQ